MIIAPLPELISLSSNYNEVLIDDGTNYIVNFLFEVIEGDPNVYVCGITREGPLGIKIQFYNKNETVTKIKLYKMLDRNLLASNFRSDNPVVVGTKKNYVTVPVGYSETSMLANPIEVTAHYFYYYSFKVIDGSKQIHVANFKFDSIHTQSLVTIGLHNSGPNDAMVNLNLLSIDHLVDHNPQPVFQEGNELKLVDTQEITIASNTVGKVAIQPSNANASVIMFTFNIKTEKKRIYICGQNYNGKSFNLEFFNENEEDTIVEVSGWETYPYGTQ